MRLDSLFKTKKCPFALEVFPPKRTSNVSSVYGTLDQLAKLPVDYISVTYSAGGNGAKEYTAQIAQYLKDTLQVEPLAHLTCVSSSKTEVQAALDTLRKTGIENILALRGDRNPDPAFDNGKDFIHANQLIEEISSYGGFYTAAACYPEGHPESPSLTADIQYLQHKLDAGAGHFVSQLFFDNSKFFGFLNLLRKSGIACPVEAGIMPIVRKEQIQRTVSLSSASLPSGFTKMVSKYSTDPDSFYEAGLEYSINQIRELIEFGVDGIHLYAMNNPTVATRVYEGIADLL